MKHSYRIWVLMNKKISMSISPAEEQELEMVLLDDPELWYSYEILQAVMSQENVPEEFIKEIKLLLEERTSDTAGLNEVLLKTLQQSPVKVPAPVVLKRINRRLLTIATVAAFFMFSVWLLIMNRKRFMERPAVAMNEIIVPKGSKTRVILADGTAIWLNAGSKLVYPKNFSMENREVYLVGEAYFKVVHNSRHLFVVHTAESDITDLGTVFNVKAYAGSPVTETTLIEGAVQVTIKKSPQMKIMMRPREKLVLNHGQKTTANKDRLNGTGEPRMMEVLKIVPYEKTNDVIETAWVHDKLIFRQQRFGELIKELERRYNVSISINDEMVKDYQLSGIFTTENVEQALGILQQIAPFKFKINNDRIIITR